MRCCILVDGGFQKSAKFFVKISAPHEESHLLLEFLSS